MAGHMRQRDRSGVPCTQWLCRGIWSTPEAMAELHRTMDLSGLLSKLSKLLPRSVDRCWQWWSWRENFLLNAPVLPFELFTFSHLLRQWLKYLGRWRCGWQLSKDIYCAGSHPCLHTLRNEAHSSLRTGRYKGGEKMVWAKISPPSLVSHTS